MLLRAPALTAPGRRTISVRPRRQTTAEFSSMTINIVLLQPLIALLAGILILIMPRLLNFIVAIYLIVIGISGLWPHLMR
jgi:hypothetical protein